MFSFEPGGVPNENEKHPWQVRQKWLGQLSLGYSTGEANLMTSLQRVFSLVFSVYKRFTNIKHFKRAAI